jgi:hypothetical protein
MIIITVNSAVVKDTGPGRWPATGWKGSEVQEIILNTAVLKTADSIITGEGTGDFIKGILDMAGAG